MKKIMFMIAAVACAGAVQAAAFKWTTTSKLYGVTSASVTDNGDYSAATSGTTDRGDKALTSLSYVLAILDATTGTEVGSASGTVGYGTLGKVSTSGIEIAGVEQGTAYKYQLTLTGTQSTLTGKGNAVDGGDGYDYDYTAAIVTTTISGDITTAVMGDTAMGDIVPTTWTVSGITKTAQSGGGGGSSDVPEPTSGLLLVLGGAMLALRRRRA